MKVPNFERITEESLEADDLSPLAEQLNRPISNIVSALQGRLTFGENFAGKIQEFTLDGTFPLSIRNPLPVSPTAIVPLSTNNPAAVESAPWVNWELSGNSIKITSVLGVIPTQTNKLKLKVLIL